MAAKAEPVLAMWQSRTWGPSSAAWLHCAVAQVCARLMARGRLLPWPFSAMRRAPLSAAWLPWAKASFLFRCHGMALEQRQAMTTPSRCYCPCGVLHLRAVRHLRCFARVNWGSDAGTLDMLCTDCRLVRCYTGKKDFGRALEGNAEICSTKRANV